MPTTSIDAATAWRKENLDPAWAKLPGAARTVPIHLRGADALALVKQRGLAAHAAIGTAEFPSHLPALRRALHAVPLRDRERVAMTAEIWDALTLEVGATLGRGDQGQPAAVAEVDTAAEDFEALGSFWYSAAAGEVVPNMDGA